MSANQDKDDFFSPAEVEQSAQLQDAAAEEKSEKLDALRDPSAWQRLTAMTCLSFWYPKIVGHVPTPATTIVKAPPHLGKVLEGEKPEGFEDFVDQIREAAASYGYPIFLRTGHTSGKHEWNKTCFVKRGDDVPAHIVNLVEFSELVDMIGLPYDIWVVREMLDTIPQLRCEKYGDMPVCREFRFFVRDGKVVCYHPYWPKKALIEGMSKPPADIADRHWSLCYLPQTESIKVHEIAAKAGDLIGGSWAVDICETRSGWVLTDMAVASQSWHMPGCKHEGAFQ